MSEKFHNGISWGEYNKRIKSPRELCICGISFVDTKEMALDFGGGSLIDTKYMRNEAGFLHVRVIDADPDTKERVDSLADEGVSLESTTFETATISENTFDFINAQNSVGFINKDNYDSVVDQLLHALKPSGVIAVNFFGDRDDWNTPDSGKVCVSEEHVRSLLSETKIIHWEEIENDRGTALGNPKHWHTFEVIARKI